MTKYLNLVFSWEILTIINNSKEQTSSGDTAIDPMPNLLAYARYFARRAPSSTCSSRLAELPTELLLLIADNLDELMPLHQTCRRFRQIFRRRVLQLAVGQLGPTNNFTWLHWAVVHRDYRLVVELLGEECWRKQIDQPARVVKGFISCFSTGASALVWACLTVQPLSIIEFLLSSGASPDIPLRLEKSSFTPLIWAIRTSRRELVHLLLRYNASPLIPQEMTRMGLWYPQASPIHLAVAMNNGAMVAQLLTTGFDIDAAKCIWYEEEWISPIEAAVAYSKTKAIKAFTNAGHGDRVEDAQQIFRHKPRVAPCRWRKTFEIEYYWLRDSINDTLPRPPLLWWRYFDAEYS